MKFISLFAAILTVICSFSSFAKPEPHGIDKRELESIVSRYVHSLEKFPLAVEMNEMVAKAMEQLTPIVGFRQINKLEIGKTIIMQLTKRLVNGGFYIKPFEAGQRAALIFMKHAVPEDLPQGEYYLNEIYIYLDEAHKSEPHNPLAQDALNRTIIFWQSMQRAPSTANWREYHVPVDRFERFSPFVYESTGGKYAIVQVGSNLYFMDGKKLERTIGILKLSSSHFSLSDTGRSLLIYYPDLNQTDSVSLETLKRESTPTKICIDALLSQENLPDPEFSPPPKRLKRKGRKI